MQRYKYIVANIAYDYRIIIIIREYEIFTEYKIHIIVCLEPDRGINCDAPDPAPGWGVEGGCHTVTMTL